MKKSIAIVVAALAMVALAVLMDKSEGAGLFGAIIAVGLINAHWK